MRLLLLLSAILAALTGVGGTRAPTQAVQASAVTLAASADVAAAAIIDRVATPGRARIVSPLPLPAIAEVARRTPLYADRLLE